MSLLNKLPFDPQLPIGLYRINVDYALRTQMLLQENGRLWLDLAVRNGRKHLGQGFADPAKAFEAAGSQLSEVQELVEVQTKLGNDLREAAQQWQAQVTAALSKTSDAG